MRDITLCLSYYDNPGMLVRQLDFMKQIAPEAREHVKLIVVDDGSPRWPAHAYRKDCVIDFEIYRITKDVRWNQDAARNIAAHHATTRWLLLTDIDHMVPKGTWRRLMSEAFLSEDFVYKFSRLSETPDPAGYEPTLTPYKPHPNSWLMTKAMYWKIGGYDERFAGWYGTDGDFRDRVKKNAHVFMFDDPIIRVPREVTPDASTTTYQRKTDADGDAIQRIKAERAEIPNWQPLNLTFPYDRVELS